MSCKHQMPTFNARRLAIKMVQRDVAAQPCALSYRVHDVKLRDVVTYGGGAITDVRTRAVAPSVDYVRNANRTSPLGQACPLPVACAC